MPNGDYEFKFYVLKIHQANGTTIFGVTQLHTMLRLKAHAGTETMNIANYTLSVSGDMTVSYCAGTCDAECSAADPYVMVYAQMMKIVQLMCKLIDVVKHLSNFWF